MLWVYWMAIPEQTALLGTFSGLVLLFMKLHLLDNKLLDTKLVCVVVYIKADCICTLSLVLGAREVVSRAGKCRGRLCPCYTIGVVAQFCWTVWILATKKNETELNTVPSSAFLLSFWRYSCPGLLNSVIQCLSIQIILMIIVVVHFYGFTVYRISLYANVNKE